MPTRKLLYLFSHFVSRTNRLVIKYDSLLPPDPGNKYMCSDIHDDAKTLMIIRLHLLWGQFCKELICISALGGCSTISGTKLQTVTAITCRKDIEQMAKKEAHGWTPWHKPAFAVRMAQNLGTANFNQLQLALSRVSPIDDLKIIRDYIVHPWESTRLAYIQVSRKLKTPGIEPVPLLATRGRYGYSVFKSWILELQNIALDSIK